MLRLIVRELNEKELQKTDKTSKIPQIAVELVDEQGESKMRTRYIYGMRGYSFQVGGLNANGADVDTTVVGLGNIVRAFKNMTPMDSNSSIYSSNVKYENIPLQLINSLALTCIMKFYNSYIVGAPSIRSYCNEDISQPIKIDIDMPYAYEDDNQSKQVWKKFIEETYALINEMVEKDMGN